jgi:uncharacterized protein (DUF488 family)
MAEIWTVGHSNKTAEQLVDLLQKAGVKTIVDVRTSPWSKWNPQFNERPLQESLRQGGILYLSRGKNLGGKGVNVNYDGAIDELTRRAEAGERMAVMCSEGDFHKCHRFEMLTPSLEAKGLTVTHLLWTGEQVSNQKVETPRKVIKPEEPGLFELSEVQSVRRDRVGFVAP